MIDHPGLENIGKWATREDIIELLRKLRWTEYESWNHITGQMEEFTDLQDTNGNKGRYIVRVYPKSIVILDTIFYADDEGHRIDREVMTMQIRMTKIINDELHFGYLVFCPKKALP